MTSNILLAILGQTVLNSTFVILFSICTSISPLRNPKPLAVTFIIDNKKRLKAYEFYSRERKIRNSIYSRKRSLDISTYYTKY